MDGTGSLLERAGNYEDKIKICQTVIYRFSEFNHDAII